MNRLSRFVFFILLALICGARVATAENTANEIMPGCRELIAFSHDELWGQPFCLGFLSGLSYASNHGCAPKGVTQGQIARVVVKYIDSHPERMQEQFGILALEALTSAFPCR
jgi:hypothetical protein